MRMITDMSVFKIPLNGTYFSLYLLPILSVHWYGREMNSRKRKNFDIRTSLCNCLFTFFSPELGKTRCDNSAAASLCNGLLRLFCIMSLIMTGMTA